MKNIITLAAMFFSFVSFAQVKVLETVPENFHSKTLTTHTTIFTTLLLEDLLQRLCMISN
jgi:hypothetical protein